MNHFEYKNDQLFCENVAIAATIAEEVGTPLYVYSKATLERHFGVFDRALDGVNHLICFSVKANSNLSVLRLLFALGAGADIVSGGELTRVLAAGGDPKKVVFSGVGKSDAEMRQALKAGVLAFNVESEPELDALAEIAQTMGLRAPVSLRVNPDVDAQTHPYISTGLKNNKFGIPTDRAYEVYRRAAKMQSIEIVGVDCHIGSQLTKTAPFSDAIARLVTMISTLSAEGIAFRYLDLGGGLGIPYGEAEEPTPPSPSEYGQAIVKALEPLAGLNLTILCEPGRVIAGNAGSLITQVIFDKPSEAKRFLVVDAAMNDLMRPSFYGSYHPMKPVVKHADRPDAVVDVVGPICETGDFLARDRALPEMKRGELLCIGAAGAYGFTMSSNYNTRPRAAEVLVDGDSYRVIRRRETVEQLLALEQD